MLEKYKGTINFFGTKLTGAVSRLTLFGSDCYSRRVPFGRGFEATFRQAGIVIRVVRQVGLNTTNDHASSPLHHVPHPSHTEVCGTPERL